MKCNVELGDSVASLPQSYLDLVVVMVSPSQRLLVVRLTKVGGRDVTAHDLNLSIEMHLELPDLGVVSKLLVTIVRH